MKKTILATALVALFSTSVLGVVANAEAKVVANPTTDATITFNVDDNEKGEIIIPDEEDGNDEVIQIPPTAGTSTAGPLRIQFVPNFAFGERLGITSKEQVTEVQSIAYNDKANVSTGKKIAPFAQVSDTRGLTDDAYKLDKWTLSVVATEFATTAGHELTGSKISLKGSTLTTSNGDTAKAKTLAKGHDTAAGDVSSTPLVVLTSSETNNTNGYQVSNVFMNDYKKDTPAADRISDVIFTKPADITPQADVEYKSTLTWTLTSGL